MSAVRSSCAKVGCDGRHRTLTPEELGGETVGPLAVIEGGQGKGASEVRDSAVIAAFAFTGIVAFAVGVLFRAACS